MYQITTITYHNAVRRRDLPIYTVSITEVEGLVLLEGQHCSHHSFVLDVKIQDYRSTLLTDVPPQRHHAGRCRRAKNLLLRSFLSLSNTALPYIIGASMSEPSVQRLRCLFIYLFIYIFIQGKNRTPSVNHMDSP